jgi:hypothetical protein
MSDYDRHGDLILSVQAEAEERRTKLEKELKEAFKNFIKLEEVEVVFFSEMSVTDLANVFLKHPSVLKPVLVACNIAARAIERDLDIRNVDTYKPRLNELKANQLAGYLKPFLPAYIAVPALSALDTHFFIDKEIRASKGRWEKLVLDSLNEYGKAHFKKRKFKVGGQSFELDAAAPIQGEIEIGVDVKRIEARRDIHKRCDEIVNKAAKFKDTFPNSKFAAVVYYPFVDEHVNVQNRLKSPMIDSVVFAGSSSDSIVNAVRTLLINCEFANL